MTSTLTPQLVRHLRRLACTVAPEIQDRPFYLIDMAELWDLLEGTSAIGFAVGEGPLNVHYVDRLGSQYRGPGPLIAIDGARIYSDSSYERGSFQRALRAVLIHELAHCLPPAEMVELTPCPLTERVHAEMLRRHWSAPIPRVDENEDHDINFVRRCGHLYHRAIAAGFDVHPRDVMGYQAQLSSLEEFLPFITGEAKHMAASPFSRIHSTPMPAGLEAFYQEDVAWHRGLFTPTLESV